MNPLTNHECWMNVAHVVSLRSKDPRTQVGCVIVKPGLNHPVTTGYNGFPIGVSDTIDLWEPPKKYDWSCHAEFNAVVLSARRGTIPLEGCEAYVTHMPCVVCMRALIQAGIRHVYVDATSPPSVKYEEERQKALEIAEAAGLGITYMYKWVTVGGYARYKSTETA